MRTITKPTMIKFEADNILYEPERAWLIYRVVVRFFPRERLEPESQITHAYAQTLVEGEWEYTEFKIAKSWNNLPKGLTHTPYSEKQYMEAQSWKNSNIT